MAEAVRKKPTRKKVKTEKTTEESVPVAYDKVSIETDEPPRAIPVVMSSDSFRSFEKVSEERSDTTSFSGLTTEIASLEDYENSVFQLGNLSLEDTNWVDNDTFKQIVSAPVLRTLSYEESTQSAESTIFEDSGGLVMGHIDSRELEEPQEAPQESELSPRLVFLENDVSNELDTLMDLNVDVEIQWPKTFVESAEKLLYQKLLTVSEADVEPFTAQQLAAFYVNSLTVSKQAILGSFVSNLDNLHSHPLHESLSAYLRAVSALEASLCELRSLRNQIQLAAEDVWLHEERKVTGEENCLDGKTVRAHAKFSVAVYNPNKAAEVSRLLKLLRQLEEEQLILHSYSALLCKYRIDAVIAGYEKSELYAAISVLFSFMRRLIRNKTFLEDLKEWLSFLAGRLLQDASREDYLFLAHHVLRCPAGLRRHLGLYIQCPPFDHFNPGNCFNTLDVASAILSLIMEPVAHRENFLRSWKLDSEADSNWVMLDSEGESDESVDPLNLTDSDLVALLKQLPVADVIRHLLVIFQRDGKDVYDSSLTCQPSTWLRLFAVTSQLLKILQTGLVTYNAAQYKNFAKKIGQTVCHLICTLNDHWENSVSHLYSTVDHPMFQRLRAEYENTFTQGTVILISSRKQRLWQYTSNLPFSWLSTETRFQIWALFHWQIFSECGEEFTSQSLTLASFWSSLVSKMSALPEPDLFLYVVTVGNLVSDVKETQQVDYFRSLVNMITWELIGLGLVEESTSPLCFKTCRDTLTSLAKLYPETLSFVIHRLNETLPGVGRAAVQFVRDLPFHLCDLGDSDFSILRTWLMKSPLNSVNYQLAVAILDSLDYDRPDGTALSRRVALLLVEAVDHFGTVAIWPSVVSESVQYVSSLLRSQNWTAATFTQWAWHLASRLRLHAIDRADVKDVLANLQEGLGNIPILDSNPSLQKLRDSLAARNPFSAFVALSMTDIGHSVPELCSRGFDLMSLLSNAHRYQEILYLMEEILPLFLTCPDALYSQPKFLSIVQSVVNADTTYYKLAKSIFQPDAAGKFLRSTAGLIERTLACPSQYNLVSNLPVLEMWLNILVRLPKWNVEKSTLFLLDLLAREAFLCPGGMATVQRVFSAEFSNAWVYRPSKGLASKVGSWVSGVTEFDSSLPPSSTVAADGNYCWLTWLVLDMEVRYQESLWNSLKTDLDCGKKSKSIDSLLKSLASKLKLAPVSLNGLCLLRYAQFAVDLKPDNNLLPLVFQRFFGFFLSQLPSGGAAGDRVLPAGHPLHKKLLNQIREASSIYSNTDTSSLTKYQRNMNKRLGELFQAFAQWLQDKRIAEPNCYLPTLPPNYLGPRLLQLFEGDTELWLEFFDPGTLFEEKKAHRVSFLKERRSKDPGREIPSSSPDALLVAADRLLQRLSCYDKPGMFSFRPIVAPFRRLQAELKSPQLLQEVLEPHLQLLLRTAEAANQRLAQQTALDCTYVELLAEEYENVEKEAVLSAKCGGPESKDQCSGAALIKVSYVQSRQSEVTSRHIGLNREETSNLLEVIVQPPPSGVCTAALLIEDCVEQLVSSKQQRVDVGAALFYLLVQFVNDETNAYLPTKQLLSTCVEMLGRSFVSGQVRQCCNLVAILGSNPGLSQMLAPHFDPCNAVASSRENLDAFLEAYALVTGLPKAETDLIFVLLTKFDIQQWLRTLSGPEDRSRLLLLINAALSSYGLQPPANSLMVHEVLRRHLQLVLLFNFPQHYVEVLDILLKGSDLQSLSVHVWYDVTNALGQGYLRLQPTLSMADCNKQILNYTIHSSIFRLPELTKTVTILASHYSHERQTHGLYGLYPKYRPYIHALGCFYSTLGHLLCFTILEDDTGTASNELVGKIWTQIRDLYSPWLLPYSQQQISSSCASWIQQLSSDRALLLPWIATDAAFASTMLTSFIQCVQFVHETLPAQQSILGHVMNLYLQGYCHRGVKTHVFSILHSELCALPWEQYIPSSSDMEGLAQVAAQFLPEAHSFLAEIFVRIRWNSIVEMWSVAYPRPLNARLLAYLLHLFVRLSAEPTAKQSSQMQRVLEEACSYCWDGIDATAYEQSLHGFISTCEPHFVLQPFVAPKQCKDFPSGCSLDAVLFRLLQSAGSSCVLNGIPVKTSNQDSLLKRRLFVKAWLKLVSTAASRYRNTLAKQPTVITNALKAVVQHIVVVSKIYHPTPSECCQIVIEALSLMSTGSILSSEMTSVLCEWIKSANSEFYLIQAMFQKVFTLNTDADTVTVVAEHVLEKYFTFQDESPRWSDVKALVQHSLATARNANLSMKELSDSCVENGRLLTLYALTSGTEDVRADDVPERMKMMATWFEKLKLTEQLEAKLVPYYKWIAVLVNRAAEIVEEKSLAELASARNDIASVLSAWMEENKGWFASIGFSKNPSLSPKGRVVARVILAGLRSQESAHLQQDLLKMRAAKGFAECWTAIDAAVELLTAGSPVISVVEDMISKLTSVLYAETFLVSL